MVKAVAHGYVSQDSTGKVGANDSPRKKSQTSKEKLPH